jgi:hypothetical protein
MYCTRYFRAGKFNSPRSINLVKSLSRVRCLILCHVLCVRASIHACTGHDFFTPQPVHNASVFFLRYIVHNWSDPYARKILTHLRGAATRDTTLVVVDHILPYACPQATIPPDVAALSEALDTAAPPLLPNFGAANALGHSLDSLASIL